MSGLRSDELWIDRAVWGLDGADEGELATGIEQGEIEHDPVWERLVAISTYAMLEDEVEEAPSDLTDRLEADARRHFASLGPQGLLEGGRPAQRASSAGLAWFVAAASILFAVWVGVDRFQSPPDVVSVREELLARADVMRLDWAPGPSDRAGEPRGDVVWSPSEQRGFMRFAGLPQNDPGAFQYQLWIFDGTRGESAPVDGGVFDIPDASVDTIIPIDAKLPVGEAVTFAVTIEAPGGVVVSNQEHIVTLAKP